MTVPRRSASRWGGLRGLDIQVPCLSLLLVVMPATSLASLATNHSAEPAPGPTTPPRVESPELEGAPHDADRATGLTPRQLSGEYVENRAWLRTTDGLDEISSPSPAPRAAPPVIAARLAQRLATLSPEATLRVLVFLRALPQARVAQDIRARHAAEWQQIQRSVQSIVAASAARRNTSLPRDADNRPEDLRLSAQERSALTPLLLQHEALSLTTAHEMAAALEVELRPSVDRVRTRIEELGGEFEFNTLAGSVVVASMPAGAVPLLAELSDVLRINEDSLLHAQLDNAVTAAGVDALGGLWDSSNTGGIFDPAVIDSGIDLQHPGMADGPSRINFFSWYLVAGNGSSSFAELCCSIDDFHGHGTHVAGVVASQGTSTNPDQLGFSHGVDKLVSLKAGWLSTNGRASMFWSDKYNVVDRALYDSSALAPYGTFGDDVDGMSFSFGGATTLDDTDGSRFWDSVISTYADLPVTIAVGNEGPDNTLFSDPANSYNAITVGSYDDRGTVSVLDDTRYLPSSVGPTANNRRKPDLAAPGVAISSANTFWEDGEEVEYIEQSGTSASAPAVLGVVMDLLDAGVLDELRIKALLLNTARKNLPGMNFESDADGWDPQLGWGALDALAAYHHRFDTFYDTVTPNGTPGDFRLYKGVLRDEGPTGAGRDRVTMVWNRVATYNTAAAPNTYYSLPDLNLRLYEEDTNALLNADYDFNDNVHQVRIGGGVSETDVIVNAYAWSASFDHGGATQAFVLATEEGFVPVEHPSTFQAFAIWPPSVEPGEEFTITFWLRNDSEIASHGNLADLELPFGWTLVAGPDVQAIGSAPAGGNTNNAVYTLKAPLTAVGAQTFVVKHRHLSSNEAYGDFNWNVPLTVEYDNSPPLPDPMSFQLAPFAVSQSELSMAATVAEDAHEPVEYYLDFVSSPSLGTGGSDSGWQAETDFANGGLEPNHGYCYRAWARDSAISANQTTPSPLSCDYTFIERAPAPQLGAVTATSITTQAVGAFTNLGIGTSGVAIDNVTNGATSGWTQDLTGWSSLALEPNTQYTFVAKSRNVDGIESAPSPASAVFTLAALPAVESFGTVTHESVTVRWASGGNPGGTEYFAANLSTGANSGWTAQLQWADFSTSASSVYSYLVKARNGAGVETGTVLLGTVHTPFFGDGFEAGSTLAWSSIAP